MSWLPESTQMRLALVLAHFVWQGTLLALGLSVLMSLFRVRRSEARYAASLVAFALLAAAPVVTWFCLPGVEQEPHSALTMSAINSIQDNGMTAASRASLPETRDRRMSLPSVEAADASDLATSEVPMPELAVSQSIRRASWWPIASPWIVRAWFIGVLLLSLRLLCGAITTWSWRWRSAALPESLRSMVEQLCQRLRMRVPRVRLSGRLTEALAIGVLRPMVLLPATWATEMPPDMLEAVLAHELAHLRRFDLWVNLLQGIVETLLFYHPAVWWLSQRLRRERELCCDELAVSVTQDNLRYAEMLEHVGRLKLDASPTLLAVTMSNSKHALLDRVKNVLQPQTRGGSWSGAVAIGCLSSVLMTVGLLSWFHQPQANAQTDSWEPQVVPVEFRKGPKIELLAIGTHSIEPSVRWAANGARWKEPPRAAEARRLEFSKMTHELAQHECREILVRVSQLPAGQTHLAYQWSFDGHMDWAHRAVLSSTTEFTAGFWPKWNPMLPISKTMTLRIGIGELPDEFVRVIDASGKKVAEELASAELRAIDALVEPLEVDESNGNVELILKPFDRSKAPIVVDYVPVAIGVDGKKYDTVTGRQRPGVITYTYPISRKQVARFECHFRRYQHQVTFENVALEAGHKTSPTMAIAGVEERRLVKDEQPITSDWGPVTNGLRMRVVPVSPTMSEDAVELANRLQTFETIEDVSLAVEIENVSDAPVSLRDVRYGPNFGESSGKLAPDWFGQFLFAIDYFDAAGQRSERPELIPVRNEFSRGGDAQATTLPSKQTLRMLLKPNRWISAFSQQPLVGQQRAVVRYRGVTAEKAEDVVAGVIEFNVRKRGYRPAGVPSSQLGDDPQRDPELEPDITKQVVWGEPKQGLRAALDVVPVSPLQSLSHGTKPKLKLLVQNVSDQPVTLATLMWLSELPVKAKNAKGEDIAIQTSWYTGITPVVRVRLKPQQVVTLDAGNLGLAATKERAGAFEHVIHRRMVAPRGTYELQATERFGTSFQLKDGDGNVIVPSDGDFKSDLTTGSAKIEISNEVIVGDIVDAVTGQPVEGTTVNFIIVKPKTATSDEQTLAHMVWGPKSPAKIYFTIPEVPEDIAQRADRDELEIRWAVGNQPDYEDYAPEARIPLKEFFHAGPKTAREVLRTIKLTPKKKAETKDEKPNKKQDVLPQSKQAQSLFQDWQRAARANGNIPGGTIQPLVRVMTRFVKNNPTHEGSPKFTELLKRVNVAHDWSREEAIKLLDEVSAIYPSLPEWVQSEHRFYLGGDVVAGKPLPNELKDAPWGEAHANGLRTAWLLEPRGTELRLITPLKSRLLFHNSGKNSVMFRALTWNQIGGHRALNAKGQEIKIDSVEWTTLPSAFACRLAPGEFLEVFAAGMGVGSNRNDEDWGDSTLELRIGDWLNVRAGDEVTFIPGPVDCGGREGPHLEDELPPDRTVNWWLKFIRDRLSLDTPLPADADERGRMLGRAVRDLFGNEPTSEELTAFKNDASPEALDTLAKRLSERAGYVAFDGSLQSGSTKFKVLPVDPNAPKKPRTAKYPGQYPLGGKTTLVVTRRPDGERVVNAAHLAFAPTDATQPAPREPYPVPLPDGDGQWLAAWMSKGTVLWVGPRYSGKKTSIRRFDFSNPAAVKESVITEEKPSDLLPQTVLEVFQSQPAK